MAEKKLDFYDAQEQGLGSAWSVGDLMEWMRDEGEIDSASAERLTDAFGGASEPVARIPEGLCRHLKEEVAAHADDAPGFMRDWLDENVTYVLDRSEPQYGGRVELHLLSPDLRSAINAFISLAPDGSCYAGLWDGTDEHECQLAADAGSAITAAREAGACADVEQLDVEDVEREDDAWYTPEGLREYLEWMVSECGDDAAAAASAMRSWLDGSVETVVDWSDACAGGGLELRTVDDNYEGLYIALRADGCCAAGGWEGADEREIPLSEAASEAVVSAWRAGACNDADIWTPDPVDWDEPGELAAELRDGVAANAQDAVGYLRGWLADHAYDVLDLTDESEEVVLEVQLFDERAQAKLGYVVYLSVHADGQCYAGVKETRGAGRAVERPLSKKVGTALIEAAQESWPVEPTEDWNPWAGLKS